MDVLSDVLKTICIQSVVQLSGEFYAPWGIRHPAQNDRAIFYLISRGSCYLEVEGVDSPVQLAGGDLVMMPHGSAHTLRDRLQSQPIELESMLEKGGGSVFAPNTTVKGDCGEKSIIVSGYFIFEPQAKNHFLGNLPPLIRVSAEEDYIVPWLEQTLRFLAVESASNIPGARIVTARLTDILFIQILRAHLAQQHQAGECNRRADFLRALVDEDIGKAITLIHTAPQRAWTVAELAGETGMSRTAFAVKFTKVSGYSPLDYVRKWRMLMAGDMLRQGQKSIEEIAEQVGYESVAFRKAFKKEMGLTPKAFSQEQRE